MPDLTPQPDSDHDLVPVDYEPFSPQSDQNVAAPSGALGNLVSGIKGAAAWASRPLPNANTPNLATMSGNPERVGRALYGMGQSLLSEFAGAAQGPEKIEPSAPGWWTEEDQFRQNQATADYQRRQTQAAGDIALTMLGGVGGAEEGAAGIGGGKLKQPTHTLEPVEHDPFEYRGEHGAPDSESGSPLHDVTANGTYPTDFYGPNGLRYYGTGDDALDAASYQKILNYKDKPDAKVPVWRAIPWDGVGKDPVTQNSSNIYPGDWVSISRQYAMDHGESALNGNYQLTKAMKPARELFTSGDSMHEWGWSPQETSADLGPTPLPMDEASRMARAADQGYTIDAYHGTKTADQLGQFDLRKAGASDPGLLGRAVYLTPEPMQASSFAESPHYGREGAPSVLPLKAKLDNPVVIQDGVLPDGRRLTDLHPNGITNDSASSINRELKSAGYDGAIFTSGGEPVQYAVFDPANVRSRYAAFNPANTGKPAILGSGSTDKDLSAALTGLNVEREAQAPRFYSAVEKAVDSAKMNSALAGQWLGMLKNTPGVKPEELDWLGVQDFLNGQKGNVPKQALADYVRSNKVDVQEVLKNDVGGPRYLTATEPNPSKPKYGPGSGMGEPLPGGELGSYRELLLTLPRVDRDTVHPDEISVAKYKPEWDRIKAEIEPYNRALESRGFVGGGSDLENINRLSAQLDSLHTKMIDETMGRVPAYQQAEYKSSHWDEPNVLAHVRFDDRTLNEPSIEQIREIGQRMAKAVGAPAPADMGSGAPDVAVAKGAITPQEAAEFSKRANWQNKWADQPGLSDKTLHISEIQSDWGQALRRERKKISDAIDNDFDGIADRMVKLGVIKKVCD